MALPSSLSIPAPPQQSFGPASSSRQDRSYPDDRDDSDDRSVTPTGTIQMPSSRYNLPASRASTHPSAYPAKRLPGSLPHNRSPSRSHSRYSSGHYPHPPNSSAQQIPIPSAIPPISKQQDSTPLPTLPILVLCFAMISEFLSASVSGPFIFFMIEDFGVGGGEAAVGFWAGIVSSVFFLSQFLTSLLWSNVSNTHGRRVVLFSSLLGNALTLLLFGSSTSLGMAICARLGQGVFNGAIGVARGAVRDLTDASNEGRAIAWIGLCWGMGGIAGPIIGGLLEHPAENYPALFGRFQFLKDYPYFLPCFVASCITFTGAMLSLFLGWDGGYRTGQIALGKDDGKLEFADRLTLAGDADEEDESLGSDARPQEAINLLPSSDSQTGPNRQLLSRSIPAPQDSQSVVIKNPLAMSRSSTRQTAQFTPGSAYGYDRPGSVSRRPPNWRGRPPIGSVRTISNTLNRRNSRAISLARSFGADTQYAPDYEDLEHMPPALNFAQRLLLSNEDAVFGLHDVWLAAATTQDREDEFAPGEGPECDNERYDSSVFEDDESRLDEEGHGLDDRESVSEDDSFDERGRGYGHHQRLQSQSSRHSETRRPDSAARPRHSFAGSSHLPLPGSSSTALPNWLQQKMRTTSTASSVRPAIFSNTGLATPPSMSSPSFAPRDRLASPTGDGTSLVGAEPGSANLAAIPESDPSRQTGASEEVAVEGAKTDVAAEKASNVFGELPLAIIAQYAILALHGTTCDQVFMSFLVTPIRSGGLGLSAGHYAELIAAMCIAQIVFQFRFYPTVGPPRGQLTHLSMFRLGLCLYIPVYMLLPELRGLLRESHDGLVMFGMILLCSFRWLANVCAYTAVMVMINAQTPPHLVPLANGLAQSAVSAARFVGPVFGGMVWSFSITPAPDSRSYPFNNSLGFVVITLICFLGLLGSFKLK